MKVNFVKTYDVMNFEDSNLGDVFLDGEDDDNKCIFMKIDTSDCDDNAYNLTENRKSHFDADERVYRLQAELNVLKMI